MYGAPFEDCVFLHDYSIKLFYLTEIRLTFFLPNLTGSQIGPK